MIIVLYVYSSRSLLICSWGLTIDRVFTESIWLVGLSSFILSLLQGHQDVIFMVAV